jgi:Na+/melibiose symporter-like transporter
VSSVEPLYSRASPRTGRLKLSTQLFQAIGALPDTFKSFAFGTFLLFYYNQVLGLSALKASWAISAALIIDAAIDPMVGSFSDNLRTRLGRRHPLMYASAIPLSLGLLLSFVPPQGLSGAPLTAWLFGAVVLTNISMSLFIVPWTALYAEFSDDYAERTAIVTWRYAIGALGGVISFYLTYKFIFPNTPAFRVGQLNPHGYRVFGPVLALAVLASIIVTTHLTRREIPHLLQPVARTPRFRFMRVARELGATLKNREFLILFVGSFVAAGVSGTSDTLSIYLQTFFWGLTSAQLQWFGMAVLGAVVAFLTVGPLERLIDKKPLLMVCFALLIIDYIGMIGLRLSRILPPNGDPRLLLILVTNETVRAWLSTLLGIMFASMLADTLDLQELRTGRRQEGIFAAALAFSGKATGGVGALIAGFLLESVIRWPEKVDARHLDPALVVRLGVMGGVVVPLLYIGPLLLGFAYRVTRKSHAKVRAELDTRRAARVAAAEPDHLALEMAVLPPSQIVAES